MTSAPIDDMPEDGEIIIIEALGYAIGAIERTPRLHRSLSSRAEMVRLLDTLLNRSQRDALADCIQTATGHRPNLNDLWPVEALDEPPKLPPRSRADDA